MVFIPHFCCMVLAHTGAHFWEAEKVVRIVCAENRFISLEHISDTFPHALKLSNYAVIIKGKVRGHLYLIYYQHFDFCLSVSC